MFRVLPPRLFDTTSELRDELVHLRDLFPMQRGGEVDVRAPLLPGAETLVPEVAAGAGGVSGDDRIVARFRVNRKAFAGSFFSAKTLALAALLFAPGRALLDFRDELWFRRLLLPGGSLVAFVGTPVPLIGEPVALVGCPVALIRDPLALIRDLLPLVRDPVSLVGGLDRIHLSAFVLAGQ